jgi:hypothetical protein
MHYDLSSGAKDEFLSNISTQIASSVAMPKGSQRSDENSKRHLLGSEFDSQWKRILKPGLKKSSRCASSALRLRLLFITLRRVCRCRVSSRSWPVSDRRSGFGVSPLGTLVP